MGSMGKSDPKALGVSLHDHISRSRASITVMTSSWGDCTPGPLGMCVPSGLMPESELKKFNEAHRGVAYAIMSSGRSHFMTGSTWTEMLYQLYTPALDKQRQKYSLTMSAGVAFWLTPGRASDQPKMARLWSVLHGSD